jgi:flagellar hook-associated protein 3 FlgL
MGSWGAIYNNSRRMLQIQADALARYQEMASTGSRVNRPSDAPSDAFQILALHSQSSAVDTYKRNLVSVTDTRQITGSVLESALTELSRVRQLASQAASGTYSAQDRIPIAREIDSILEEMASLANTNHSGRYLFGGGSNAAASFAAQRENGQIVQVDYQGGSNALLVPVADGVQYATTMVGDQVFRCTGSSTPEFLGSTGAKPGAGTSNVRGDVWLTATHTATTYLGASGIAAGDSSAAGDTILGTHHTLTIDEPNHTVRLDDGNAFTFTGNETDLKLTNKSGATACVNVQGLAAGFQGTVQIRADGSLSIDDGATSVPVSFSASDAVTDSRNGRILYVDSADIAQTGMDPVRVGGTYDLFSVLISLRDAIANTKNLPQDQQMDILDNAMGALADVTGHVTEWVTTNGAQLQAMTSLKDVLDNRQALAKQQVAGLENADITDVAAQLARQQVLYQMALAATSKLLTLSMVTYMT